MREAVYIFAFLGFSATLCGLELDAALTAARSSALEISEATFQRDQALAGSEKFESAFDTTLFSEFSQTDDESQQTSAFAGEKRKQQNLSLGARRLFSSGTSVSVEIARQRNETFFPPVDPNDPNGGFGNNSVTFNPAYTTSYQIELSQELWRNFWSNEVKLQKEVARGASINPAYQIKIQAQLVQSDTENLYWNIVALRERIKISERLLKKSRDFARQMKKRVSIGRADQVDEASAEANVVAQETMLTELKINLDKTFEQLRYRIGNQDPKFTAGTLASSLRKHQAKLPAANKAAAIEFAKGNRYDLKMLAAHLENLGAKRAYGDELGKPSVKLFGRYGQNGIGQSEGASTEELQSGDHPTTTFGLKFEMPIGRTESAQEKIAAIAETSALNAKASIVKRDLERDAGIAFAELNGAKQLIAQAERKIQTFERKRRQEKVKLDQARSELVNVIRYEMEVLTARNDEIVAHHRKRLAEAQLRLLMHLYRIN